MPTLLEALKKAKLIDEDRAKEIDEQKKADLQKEEKYSSTLAKSGSGCMSE